MLAIDGHYIWDPCFAQDEDTHFAFYVQGTTHGQGDKTPRIGMAYSQDLFNWTSQSSVFGPSPIGTWDNKATWPGSVVKDHNGLWHLFYTGVGDDGNGNIQRIGHATSLDLVLWDRVSQKPCLDLTGPASAFYETDINPFWPARVMRDPYVFPNPKRSGWLMAFGARARGSSPDKAACIGLASSPDLMTWTLEKPLFIGPYAEIEHPQIFSIKGQWFALYSVESEAWSPRAEELYGQPADSGLHYLKAESFDSSWFMPANGFLGSHLFAGKAIQLPNSQFVIGNYNGDDFEKNGQLTHPLRLGIGQTGLMLQSR